MRRARWKNLEFQSAETAFHQRRCTRFRSGSFWTELQETWHLPGGEWGTHNINSCSSLIHRQLVIMLLSDNWMATFVASQFIIRLIPAWGGMCCFSRGPSWEGAAQLLCTRCPRHWLSHYCRCNLPTCKSSVSPPVKKSYSSEKPAKTIPVKEISLSHDAHLFPAPQRFIGRVGVDSSHMEHGTHYTVARHKVAFSSSFSEEGRENGGELQVKSEKSIERSVEARRRCLQTIMSAAALTPTGQQKFLCGRFQAPHIWIVWDTPHTERKLQIPHVLLVRTCTRSSSQERSDSSP